MEEVACMRIGESRLTSQGQVSVPVEVRRRLAIRPGTTLVWELMEGETGVAVRAKHKNLADVQALLGAPRTRRRTDAELKAARKEAWLQRWKRAHPGTRAR
jgi:bifunctional DNA-binding transcriptional regulator/antitoxin component of YhaV-PrlF toxin-antitoxin module